MESTIADVAKRTWEVMEHAARVKGFAETEHPTYGDGRVMIGAVSQFAREVAKEMGEDVDPNLVRAYLKSGGNVVVLGKIEGADYSYRIFVRDEWRDGGVVVMNPGGQVKNGKDEKVEERQAGPVEVDYLPLTQEQKDQLKELSTKDFERFIFTKQRRDIMLALGRCGGKVTDTSGLATQKLVDEAHLYDSASTDGGGRMSSVLSGLEEHGFLTRDVSGRKTFRIGFTEAGRKAYQVLTGNGEVDTTLPTTPEQPRPEPEPDGPEIRLASGRLERVAEVVARFIEGRAEIGAREAMDELRSNIRTVYREFEQGEITALAALTRIHKEVYRD